MSRRAITDASSSSSPSSSSKAASHLLPSILTLDYNDLARLFDLDNPDIDYGWSSSPYTRFSADADASCFLASPLSLRPISNYYSHSSSKTVADTPSTPERQFSPDFIDPYSILPKPPFVTRRHPLPTRSLTYTRPASSDGDENMATATPTPSSPPDLSSSRSSTKSSSDDELNDASCHFEEISLSSETPPAKTPLKPSSRSTRSLVRPALASAVSSPHLALSSSNLSEDLRPPGPQPRRPQNPRRNASPHNRWNRTDQSSPSPTSARSSASSPRRTPSPGKASTVVRSPSGILPFQLRPVDSAPVTPLRTVPGQLTRRKSSRELEDEIHDSDEELPEDAIIWNVPLTPRPTDSRSPSRSPQEASPIAKKSFAPRKLQPSRSKSWTDALGDLSDEVKALTTALESYADSTSEKGPSRGDAGPARLSLQNHRSMNLPVQRGHAIIDPLPVSKEKERFLTRTRPSWLPPKCQKEERKHLKEWEQMMANSMAAEKKKVASLTKENRSKERRTSSAVQMWEKEILPNWNAALRAPQTRELWWAGIPFRIRGTVWLKTISNDLHLAFASYFAALKRADSIQAQIARTDKEGQNVSHRAPSPVSESELDASKRIARMSRSLQAIESDITLTFPSLGLFQSGQPLHRSLHNILKAYSSYRSDMGYVRGICGVAALMLLYLSPKYADPNKPAETNSTDQTVDIEDEVEAKAFITLSNLLNKQPFLAFCLSDEATKDRFASHVHSVLKVKSPRLAEHFKSLELNVNDWLTPMMQSCFTTLLDHVAASRLMDILVFEGGNGAAVRGAVGVLVSLEGRLYGDKKEIADTLGWKGWVERRGEPVDLAKGRSEEEAADALIVEARRAGRKEVPKADE